MAKALMARIDDKCIEWIRRSGEFWPGGDIRVSANQWLRAAFHDSSLKKVLRENSMRQALHIVVTTRKGFVFNWVDTKLFTFISWWAHVPTSSPANNKVLESLPTIRLWYGTMHFGEWQQLGIIFWKMIFLPSKKGSSPFQTMGLQARWASYGKIPNVIW